MQGESGHSGPPPPLRGPCAVNTLHAPMDDMPLICRVNKNSFKNLNTLFHWLVITIYYIAISIGIAIVSWHIWQIDFRLQSFAVA